MNKRCQEWRGRQREREGQKSFEYHPISRRSSQGEYPSLSSPIEGVPTEWMKFCIRMIRTRYQLWLRIIELEWEVGPKATAEEGGDDFENKMNRRQEQVPGRRPPLLPLPPSLPRPYIYLDSKTPKPQSSLLLTPVRKGNSQLKCRSSPSLGS